MNVSVIAAKPTPSATDRRVTVSSTAITLNGDSTVPTFNQATKYVVLDVQGGTGNDIMVTFDGTAPTASNGHRLYDTEKLTWSVQAARAARVIRQGSSDAVLHVSEFCD